MGIYALGCAVSQSLMSLGGTLAALLWAIFFIRSLVNGDLSRMRRLEKFSIFGILAFCVLTLTHLVLIKGDLAALVAAREVPLYVIPTLALFPAFRKRLREQDLALILNVCFVAYAISSIYGISQVLRGSAAIGFLRNPLYYSYNLLFALAFFVCVFWLRPHTSLGRKALASALLALAAIVASSSRMPLIAGGSLIVVCLFAHAARAKAFRLVSVVVVGLALAITASYHMNPVFHSKMSKLVALRVRHDFSIRGRMAIWEHNKDLFLENPIWGVGYQQNAVDSADNRAYRRLWKPGHAIYAHSIYLQSLADSGIVGAGLLFASYSALAIAHPSSFFVWGTALVAGSTENVFNNSKAAHSLWFFFLLSLVVLRMRKKV